MPHVADLAALTVGEDTTRIESIVAKLRRAADSCGPGGIFTLALSAIESRALGHQGPRPSSSRCGSFSAAIATACDLCFGLAAPWLDRQAGRGRRRAS